MASGDKIGGTDEGKRKKVKGKTSKRAWCSFSLFLFTFSCASPAFAACLAAKQPKTAEALISIEHRWAKALEGKDADAVACLLAPEFMDSDPDGNLRDRLQTLAAIAQRKPGSNQLDELKVAISGDTAVVHGINRVLDAQGKERARVRFTDTFVYRDGQWRALAGHESLVRVPQPDAAKLTTMTNVEITPEQLKEKLARGEKFLLLDVREPWEFGKAHVDLASVTGCVPQAELKLIPMGDVPSRLTELDPDAPIVTMCHAGVRSLKVAVWLREQGFENVQSLRGGIDAWSRVLDPNVPVY